MRKLLLAMMLLLGMASVGHAQQSNVLVTPTASTNQQAQILCAAEPAVNTATTCVTPTPGGNQSVYVTGVFFDVCTNGTGSAQNNVSYQVTGAAGFSSATNFTTYSMAATASICQHWGYSNGGAVLFKSLPGTPITITPPSAATNNSTASAVFGYIAQ